MENNQKVIAEQELGRSLYQKLKVDFGEELHSGQIPNFETQNLPHQTLENIQVGLAYEALKEEDYKTAQKFFKILGKKYSELEKYAEETSRRTPTKKIGDKSLTEKIDLIDHCKSRFEYSKENINKLSKKYSLVQEVKGGETSFEKIVNDYQKELKEMMKGKKRKVREGIKGYNKKLGELAKICKEFEKIEVTLEKFEKKKLLSIKRRNRICIGGAITGISGGVSAIGGLFVIPFVPPLGAAMFVGGLAGLVSSLPATAFGDSAVKKEKEIEEIFGKLKETSQNVDDLVNKTYITNYYNKNNELFKKTFPKLNEIEQKYIISELFDAKKNGELDAWLTENYPKLIEEEGRWKTFN